MCIAKVILVEGGVDVDIGNEKGFGLQVKLFLRGIIFFLYENRYVIYVYL